MALIDTLQSKFGADWHPAMLLAAVVSGKDPDDHEAASDYDIKLRVDCAKTLMPYLEASRKAVEVRGEVDANFGVLRVSLFDDGNKEEGAED